MQHVIDITIRLRLEIEPVVKGGKAEIVSGPKPVASREGEAKLKALLSSVNSTLIAPDDGRIPAPPSIRGTGLSGYCAHPGCTIKLNYRRAGRWKYCCAHQGLHAGEIT